MAKDESGRTYVSEAQSKARGKWEDRLIAQDAAREERQEARKRRSDEQQLARLDAMFGEGQGAKRERARLLKRIRQQKETKKNETATKE